MKTFFRIVSGLFLLAILSACGGGGGSAGSSMNGAALFTSSPASINLIPGETATYTVGGGVPAYVASAANSAVLVSIKDKTLSITAVASGSTTVTITDNAGTKVTISVVIGTGIPLFTTAPATINLSVGARSSTFYIGGGSALYSVSVDNTTVVAVSNVGNQFSVMGLANGTANLTVTDTLGASVKIAVTVGTTTASGDITTTAPATVKLSVNSSSTFTISGGTAPYSTGSGDNSVATSTVVGNILTINGVANGSTTIKVQDSSGKFISIAVQVGNSLSLFSSAPADITVGTGAISPTFTIGGGTPPYTVVAANSIVATAATGAGGNTFIVSGVGAGSTVVTIKDSVGASIAVNVTVAGGSTAPLYTTAPAAVTLQATMSASYLVAGGVAPYSATSSNPAVLDVSLPPGTNLTLKALKAGTANVVITDAKGTKLPDIVVTVSGGSVSTLYSTAPSSVSMAVGTSPSYSISGGVAPYTVQSSNVGVVSVTPAFPATTSSIFTLTGVASGSGTIRITDSVGTKLDIAVSVAGSSLVDLSTTAPAAVNLGVNANANYNIIGGVAPYFVEAADTTLVTATLTGTSSYQLTGKAAGTTKIFISDSVGKKISFDLVVLAATSQAMIVSPSFVSAANVGDVLYFRVDGGNAPYTVISNNPASVSITSGTVLNTAGVFTAYMAKTGTAVSIIVSDAKGVTQTINIGKIDVATTGLSLTPQAWTIDETNNSSVTLTLAGGVAPFQVFISNSTSGLADSLAKVATTSNGSPSTLFFTDRTLTVNVGSQGTRCVNTGNTGNKVDVTFTVKDSVGNSTTSIMSIKDTNTVAGC